MSAQIAYEAWVTQGELAKTGEKSVPWGSLSPGIRDRWSAAIGAVRRSLRQETIDQSKARDSKSVADASQKAKQFQGKFATAHRDKMKAQSEVAVLKIQVGALRSELAESAKQLAIARGDDKDD